MTGAFREAQIALQIFRTTRSGPARYVECGHPAEALDHIDIIAAYQCGECGATVADETVAAAMRGRS